MLRSIKGVSLITIALVSFIILVGLSFLTTWSIWQVGNTNYTKDLQKILSLNAKLSVFEDNYSLFTDKFNAAINTSNQEEKVTELDALNVDIERLKDDVVLLAQDTELTEISANEYLIELRQQMSRLVSIYRTQLESDWQELFELEKDYDGIGLSDIGYEKARNMEATRRVAVEAIDRIVDDLKE